MSIDVFQREVGEWHRRHFPDATATHIVLKLAEEAGELAKAHNEKLLAYAPTTRVNAAQREIDGIGDIMIVLAALCDRLDVNLADTVDLVWAGVKGRQDSRVRNV